MTSKIIKYGKEIINAEAKTLNKISDLLDENFETAVKLILEMTETGHIVVSGMGKAGLIGMKISATFSSIGIPSFFLHPAEALHGDIGGFSKGDISLIISNSGETIEIIHMITTLKQMGCPIVAITGDKDNALAKHSTIALISGQHTEAGHLGLAPTTSTTAMLAIGDALAMCLMKEKNISPEDFALYHPAGKLGRALLKASEIMRQDERLCLVEESLTISEVVKKYSSTEGRPGAAAVITEEGKLAGIFTDGDLRRVLDKDIKLLDSPVKMMMGHDPKTALASDLVADVIRILTENKIDQVIIVDDNKKPIGMIDIQDVCNLSLVQEASA